MFKKINWNTEELETLFSETSQLMKSIPTAVPIRYLFPILKKESPVTHYDKRIHTIYKLDPRLKYKTIQKRKKYSVCNIAMMPFILIVLCFISALIELTTTGF